MFRHVKIAFAVNGRPLRVDGTDAETFLQTFRDFEGPLKGQVKGKIS